MIMNQLLCKYLLTSKKLFIALSEPGIGSLTAIIILTELGDIQRSRNLDKLCVFIGLIPHDKFYRGK